MRSREIREVVVSDHLAPCSYLPGRLARLPLRMAFHLTPEQFDERLAEGDRRTGTFLYRTTCPNCKACQPIRIPVRGFQPRTTQRRMKRRGDASLVTEVGEPVVNRARLDLYNTHRSVRGLERSDTPMDEDGYRDFLVETCCRTIEIRYLLAGELKAVAIADLGARSMSAVYCYFDPHYRPVSLGTYSVLRQVELCHEWKLDYLYLGLYIAESPHMNYKSSYGPHERLINGKWVAFG